jgi:hypothetical protein
LAGVHEVRLALSEGAGIETGEPRHELMTFDQDIPAKVQTYLPKLPYGQGA